MTVITISDLPADVHECLQAKAAQEGYESLEAYARSLLVREAEKHMAAPAAQSKTSRGALAHLNVEISEEDIKDLRREMWQHFPRDISQEG